MTVRRLILLAFVIGAVSSAAHTQDARTADAEADSTTTSLTIETDPAGGMVYLNGDSLGTTPWTSAKIRPGTHMLRLVPPDGTSWLSDPLSDTITVPPSGALTLRYTFTRRLLILSSPSEAEVLVHDSLLGTTPFVRKGELRSVVLRKHGYADTTLDLSSAARGIIVASLKKVWKSSAEESIFKAEEEHASSLRLYLTGATTILAGAASAYFKVRADNTYSQYVETRDDKRLAEVNRLDTAAAVALVAAQVSFGLFTYFMLSE
ncbi:MAG: hypothetical protein C4326_02600 [Ignavibacteria bacterium]